MSVKIRYGEYADWEVRRNNGTLEEDTLYFTYNPNLLYKGDQLYGAGGSFRLTEEEFQQVKKDHRIDKRMWYFVTDDRNRLLKIYAGNTLIAKASEDGSYAFTYTFPITFRN
jgi:hypothetical protein